ncbi:hypothetical protein EIP91_009221 [Steccherinum ochraceum]|uniref:Uncharacterized protein n=1 Tax=Steccherinum ochraceum TaxID=92696 RepID=A0A4R0RTQ3_9APHY|nr:hypothetical protein EIP91_009221 [Steccherinum ochraceum]
MHPITGVLLGFDVSLRDIDPTHVMLSIVVEDSFLNHSSNIFPPSNISHVRVSLDLGSCTDDLSDILAHLFCTLRNIPLAFFALELDYPKASRSLIELCRHAVANTKAPTKLQHHDIMQVTLISMDLDACARQLLKISSALEYVFVNFKHKQQPDTAWQVSRPTDGIARLRRMKDWERAGVWQASPLSNEPEFQNW